MCCHQRVGGVRCVIIKAWGFDVLAPTHVRFDVLSSRWGGFDVLSSGRVGFNVLSSRRGGG